MIKFALIKCMNKTNTQIITLVSFLQQLQQQNISGQINKIRLKKYLARNDFFTNNTIYLEKNNILLY